MISMSGNLKSRILIKDARSSLRIFKKWLNTPPVLHYLKGGFVHPLQFQAGAGGKCGFETVPDCDHFYVGREQQVIEIVVDWLKRTLAL